MGITYIVNYIVFYFYVWFIRIKKIITLFIQDTVSITLLSRPYSDVVDVEKDHPNML